MNNGRSHEICSDRAACAKGRVQRAVGVVSRQREVQGRRAVIRIADEENLSIELDCDSKRRVAIAYLGDDFTAGTKGCIQRAIGIAPDQYEVFVAIESVRPQGSSPSDNLSIRLDCDVVRR